MTHERVEKFAQRYRAQNAPWDTGITPPEIVAIVNELPPGKALDLGCGTGTNVRYLLEHGWTADGIDFVPEAVDLARTKLAGFPAESFGIHCHDVERLDEWTAPRAPYDLVVDIGCGHGLMRERQALYAESIAALLKPGGTFMLYAHQPTAERQSGWTPADIQRLFMGQFDLAWQVLSDDTTIGVPSGWYRLTRRP